MKKMKHSLKHIVINFARRASFMRRPAPVDLDGVADDVPGGDPNQTCTYIGQNSKICNSAQTAEGGPFCSFHTCPECGDKKRKSDKMCTKNRQNQPDCPSRHEGEREVEWKHSKWRLLLKLYFSPTYAVTTAIVYYADFGTDVRFLFELSKCGENLPWFFFWVRLGPGWLTSRLELSPCYQYLAD